jgi:RNA polymerase sigma factor (sigma-70 family)
LRERFVGQRRHLGRGRRPWNHLGPGPSGTDRTDRDVEAGRLCRRDGAAARRRVPAGRGDSRDAGEAEDAVHDAAVAAWRSRELLREDARFEAWFTRIVVNVCRDRLRARSRHRVVQLPADFAESARNHDRSDVLAALASRDSIGRGFAVLEPDEQIVLVLRFWRDLTVDAIAERTGIPSGTVKSRLNHALGRLRTALAIDEVTP